MSAASGESVLGVCGAPGRKERLMNWAMGDGFDLVAKGLRRVWPIPRAFGYAAVLRYDDVIEVFADPAAFPVDYSAKLAVIMGEGREFFLGANDDARHRRESAMLRRAMRTQDVPALVRQAETIAADKVRAGAGTVEVVQMMRDVAFGVLCPYFGVTAPPGADLQVWATRLFQFQFADIGDDPALLAKVEQIAPVLRAHVEELIARRKREPGPDDLLQRCLAMQRDGVPGTDDAEICTALLGLVVGGPPQPPMVLPQALEQLLRRPDQIKAARAAASADDDAARAAQAALVSEAMRFDPLAPGLFRRAAYDTKIAAGTRREQPVRKDAKIFVALRSAMKDPDFVADPDRFDSSRPADQYIHFGHGLHTCFGIHLNRALLPAMLKPLLARANLRRAPGPDGRLSKRGGFADRLVVLYDRES